MNPLDDSRILPIGDYYPQDAQGNVLNRCAPEKVGLAWQALIAAVTRIMRTAWGDRLMGVYLRGSVPAGTAVEGVSDLDAFALLKWRPEEPFVRWEAPEWAEEKADALQRDFPVASAVELMCAHHDPALPGRNPALNMVLKTQSLCIWGEDVISRLPSFRPGPDMMIYYRWFREDLARFRSGTMSSHQERRSMMKCIIRTGFELVMEREGRYATDLYPCLRSFMRFHPEYAPQMETALRLFLSPEALERGFPPELDQLGRWMEGEVARKFGR